LQAIDVTCVVVQCVARVQFEKENPFFAEKIACSFEAK